MNPFQTLSLGFILKKNIKILQIQPRYSYKEKKEYTKVSGFGRVINVSPYMILH